MTIIAKREGKALILPAQDPLISIHMASGYRDCLGMLKASLKRESCQILAEVPFHREIEREIGLHLRKYTVLVVWDPFQTYQGLLSERGAGLFLPFHFLVADIGGSTLVAALNLDFIACSASTLGVQLLLRNLEHKIRSIFSQLYRQDEFACAPAQSDREPPLTAEARSQRTEEPAMSARCLQFEGEQRQGRHP